MTLNEIMVSALSQLDRGRDGQTLDTWRDKLSHFANEAMLDLAHCLQLRHTEPVQVTDGVIDTAAFSRRCHKLLELRQDGKPVRFTDGAEGKVLCSGCADGEVTASYRYLPPQMVNPADVPGIPEWFHGLIVTYVVGRERASGDVSTQHSANIYFEIYNAGKRNIRRDAGGEDSAAFRKKWE